MSVGAAAEIKSKLAVADVVGETVALRKAGTTLKGLCPFHAEKTPSFIVTPARESWHCFGCGEGGDIFSFVMKRDGLTFPEALRLLAGKAGVEIDEQTRREDTRKGRLRDVLEVAIAFYHSVLTTHRLGQPALDYLRGRGFDDGTIERFQLGWAPGGWDTLVRQLAARRQIEPGDLAEVGLTSPGRRGPIDKFRERVIFPIRDASGHATGLGGRVLPGGDSGNGGDRDHDRGPKYLNSPATALFDKSRTLYLIDRAKGPVRKTGQAVIVEGYTDALIAHQAGFENVVASLGTALTPGQVALLTRYARRIALAYDVDPAGEHAGTLGVTALEALIRQLSDANVGIELDEVRVVRLPDGRDPDEVILASADLWRSAVNDAAPILDYLIDYHARQTDLRSPGGRTRFVDALLPTLRAIPNPVMRDAYLQQVHQVSGIEERTLREALQRVPIEGASGNRITADAVRAAPDALPVGDILRAITPVEAELLRVLLFVPAEQDRLADELTADRLPSQLARELFAALVLTRAPDERGIRPPFVRDSFLAGLHAEAALLAQALYARTGPDPNALSAGRLTYEVDSLLLKLEYDDLEARDRFLDDELAEAERAGDRDGVRRLEDRQRQLHEQRRSLDRRRDQTRLLARPVAGRA